MNRLYPDRKTLFWALWRVDMLATTASTATGFGMIFGVPLLIVIVLGIVGIDFGSLPKDAQTTASITIVGTLMVVSFLCMLLASRLVYRRRGVQCPGCGRRLGETHRENQSITTGRCQKCGAPLTADALDDVKS